MGVGRLWFVLPGLLPTLLVMSAAAFGLAVLSAVAGSVGPLTAPFAARTVALVDHTKFAKRALHRLVELSTLDRVLVDSATSSAVVSGLRARGNPSRRCRRP
ncbi:hypothetical protein ACQPZQ_45075 [Pseudonocardia sp. CA-142604]|uniref:hypothetical protein n=1 Tax=Pseudonocardia sp. CA-142604 TaxID=3240024 RepID=UPI003D933CF7